MVAVPGTEATPSGPPASPREVRAAAAVGIALALLPFAWLLTAGTFDLFAPQPRAADFHEAQVRSWFDGRWAIEPGILGIEAFEVDGEEQTYFGIMPTLLRVPVVAVTDAMDGRLTQTSMVAAVVVIGSAVSSLGWSTRWLVRGDRPVDRRDLVVAAATPFVAILGSVVLYLAGRAWVYHEALLWGSAWALVSAAALVRHLAGGSLLPLGVAGAAAVAALHSRASVGAGPLIALGLVGAAELVALRVASWREQRPWRLVGGGVQVVAVLAVTGAVAVGSYAAINMVRFGEPFRLPLEVQTYVRLSEERQAVLEANDGSLFGPRFVPTTVLQYLRPDGITLDRTYPFVGFRDEIDVVGDVAFDTLDPTASIPSSAPLFALGGVAGVIVLGSAWRRRHPLRCVVLPAAGLAGSAAGILTIGYIAHRYTGDVLPFVVVTTIVATHVVLDRVTVREARPVAWSAAALVLLAAWGIAANGALGLLYQRQEAPDVAEGLRGALVADQLVVADRVPGATRPTVRWVDELPAEVEGDDLVALNDCRGVYWGGGDRDRWAGVERTELAGGWTLDVTWPEGSTSGDLWPLLGSGDAEGANVLVAEVREGEVRVGYVWDDPDGRHVDLGRWVPVGESSRLEVVFDPVTVEIRVTVDERLAFEGYRFHPREGVEPGRSLAGGEVRQRTPGVVVLPRDASLCERLRSGA